MTGFYMSVTMAFNELIGSAEKVEWIFKSEIGQSIKN